MARHGDSRGRRGPRWKHVTPERWRIALPAYEPGAWTARGSMIARAPTLAVSGSRMSGSRFFDMSIPGRKSRRGVLQLQQKSDTLEREPA